jgi:2,4-dienoyl-CoA reductase-like NADH-dependent reductase (Old Yellow Enzyme family)
MISAAPGAQVGAMNPASILFTPFRLGPLELKNRFVSSATVECLASAG